MSGHSAASFLCSSVYLITLNQQVEEWPWNRQTHVSWSVLVLSRSHLTPVIICCVCVKYLFPVSNVPTHIYALFATYTHTHVPPIPNVSHIHTKYPDIKVPCSPNIPTHICLMLPMYTHIYLYICLVFPICTHTFLPPVPYVYNRTYICFLFPCM